MRAITAMDGVLYGVRSVGSSVTGDIALYARQASDPGADADLVWTRIGSAPEQTYALASYYGRLYALHGSPSAPTLSWRAAVADATLPYRPPSTLFFNAFGASDVFTVARLHGNGDVETTGAGNLGGYTFTHGTRANHGLAFFYNSGDGSGRVVRVAADGTVTLVRSYAPGSFGTWTQVVYVKAQPTSWTTQLTLPEYVFFYRAGSSTVVVGQFDPTTGVFSQVASISGFGTGWQRIVVTHKGDMFFYDPSANTAAWGRVGIGGAFTTLGTLSGLPALGQLAPVGNRCLLTYSYPTLGLRRLDAVHDLLGTITTGTQDTRLVPFANGAALLYDEGAQSATSVGVVERTSGWLSSLRVYPYASFGAFDRYVPLGIL